MTKITIELENGFKMKLTLPEDISASELANVFRTIMVFMTYPSSVAEEYVKID